MTFTLYFLPEISLIQKYIIFYFALYCILKVGFWVGHELVGILLGAVDGLGEGLVVGSYKIHIHLTENGEYSPPPRENRQFVKWKNSKNLQKNEKTLQPILKTNQWNFGPTIVKTRVFVFSRGVIILRFRVFYKIIFENFGLHEFYKNFMKYSVLVSLFSQQYVLPEGQLVGTEIVGCFVGVFEGKSVGFTVGPKHEMSKINTRV